MLAREKMKFVIARENRKNEEHEIRKKVLEEEHEMKKKSAAIAGLQAALATPNLNPETRATLESRLVELVCSLN